MRSSSDGLAVLSVSPTASIMIRWKASVCVVTSIFLLCCELYGWAHQSDKAATDQLSKKERIETDSENLVDDFVREEDFPTLAEWLDDREVLYKERARCVTIMCGGCHVLFLAW